MANHTIVSWRLYIIIIKDGLEERESRETTKIQIAYPWSAIGDQRREDKFKNLLEGSTNRPWLLILWDGV
jgi:hypothetical protein